MTRTLRIYNIDKRMRDSYHPYQVRCMGNCRFCRKGRRDSLNHRGYAWSTKFELRNGTELK